MWERLKEFLCSPIAKEIALAVARLVVEALGGGRSPRRSR